MNIDDIKGRVLNDMIESNPSLIKKDILYYNKIYNMILKGENPHIVFENIMYIYHRTVRTYYKYEKYIAPVPVSREEVMNRLNIYLRRIKLEKIRSKI